MTDPPSNGCRPASTACIGHGLPSNPRRVCATAASAPVSIGASAADEELEYSILYRGSRLILDDPSDATTFTRIGTCSMGISLTRLWVIPRRDQTAGLALGRHFRSTAPLLERGESKSFKPRGATGKPPDDPKNPTVSFHGERRRNDTHQSTTDPDARLFKKAVGREAKLGYLGHLLTENRHGLIVDTAVTAATGTSERDAAILMLASCVDESSRHVGADKRTDTPEMIDAVRTMPSPAVAQTSATRGSA